MHTDQGVRPTLGRRTRRGLRLAAGVLLLLALLWTLTAPPTVPPQVAPAHVTALTSGTVAAMHSPVFTFSPGWQVSSDGADPSEPAAPWLTPSGVLTFTATGQEIALLLVRGDYWGYLYVTVNGAPANRLPAIPGNTDSTGHVAGYTTLYAPEQQRANGPTPRWIVVHRAESTGEPHSVRIEVWRAWGQTPLRGVAVDALPVPTRPRWPAALLIVAAIAALLLSRPNLPRPQWLRSTLVRVTQPVAGQVTGDAVAAIGALLVAFALISRVWWLGAPGLALLGYAALASPLRWAAALLVALPFYYGVTLPILPGRATNLIDVGVWGGVAVSVGYWLRASVPWRWLPTTPWLVALTGWALVSTAAATYSDLALREWRTLFLAAPGLAVLLSACHSEAGATARKVHVLVAAWLTGGLLMAAIALHQVLMGSNLIEAEGVNRVRGLYGSPNNLALYLERLLFIPLAGALWARGVWRLGLLLLATALLGVALLLTFSKGALLLGLPVGLLTLWLGGLLLMRRRAESTRRLWRVAAVALVAGALLLPFAGTERFQRLLDFQSGTGMTRLLLWRSSLQMALDHPWLGVGPDNFLYAYRSGYLLPAAWQEPNLNHPHNIVLDWWTRLGIPGLLLGMGWMAMGVWGLLQMTVSRRLLKMTHNPSRRSVTLSLRRASPLPTRHEEGDASSQTPQHDVTTAGSSDYALVLGLLAGGAAALAHGLIDLSYAVPDLMLVWVLIFALPDLAQVNDSDAHSDET